MKQYFIVYPPGESRIPTVDPEEEVYCENHFIAKAAYQMLNEEGIEEAKIALEAFPHFHITELKGEVF